MVPSITVHELHERLTEARDDFVLLDCRDPIELQLARIEGALHIPMSEIPARIDELDSGVRYAVICHHGIRSARVVAFLMQQGIRELVNVTGGIDAYARAVDPSIPIY